MFRNAHKVSVFIRPHNVTLLYATSVAPPVATSVGASSVVGLDCHYCYHHCSKGRHSGFRKQKTQIQVQQEKALRIKNFSFS
ncbi:MAG: hypothetical protein IJW01_03605 [Paludibacteraceae bacterium]|nr:hypothetical protein [Paludibacteraceae bacterium]